MQQHQIGRTRPPTRQDRLVVFLMSVGISLLLLPLARNIHPQVIGWIVMILVIGLPVVTINILLPFSRFEKPLSLRGSQTPNDESHEASGSDACVLEADRQAKHLGSREASRRLFKTVDANSFPKSISQ